MIVRLLLLIVMGIAASCGASPAAPQTPDPATEPPPSTGGPPPPPPSPSTWDVATQGIPKIGTHNYIELSKITRVSTFRSGVGHDYSDDFERCRSMKHYHDTPKDASASSVRIYAPFSGTVTRSMAEWAGVQIHITSSVNPAFTAIFFHVTPAGGIAEGAQVTGGQRIGTHVGSQTSSDFAIAVSEAAGRRLVSWFHVMNDAVFAEYRARGMTSRDQAVISKAARDAAPLSCSGETFANGGTLANWVDLR